MFVIKKVVSRLFFPVPLSMEFLLVGMFLLWFTRRQRAGKALVTCGALLLMGLSSTFTSDALLHPLEHRYPPRAAGVIGPVSPDVTFIAVLGGGENDDPDVPITSHLSPDEMVRVLEGVLQQREIPGSKLILSGGTQSAEGMAKIAEALGVNAGDIVPVSGPRDTEEESQQIAPIVGSHRFILVTSASHMPRAMATFRKRGVQPIAAPTDYLAPRHDRAWDDLVPDGYNLYKSQVAFYEYLGLAWETLRGNL
jgi:uncharacterized SAM-binding protein YcdF (DUF218 family)